MLFSVCLGDHQLEHCGAHDFCAPLEVFSDAVADLQVCRSFEE